MVNLILDAVTTQLGNRFGNSYRYYKENVEQGLEKPCITTAMLTPTQRSRNQIQYDRTFPIVLHYFSDCTTNIKQDCYEMAEQIVECLEILQIGGKLVRCESISWQLVEDVLQIFVTYEFRTNKVLPEEETPETLETSVGHTT